MGLHSFLIYGFIPTLRPAFLPHLLSFFFSLGRWSRVPTFVFPSFPEVSRLIPPVVGFQHPRFFWSLLDPTGRHPLFCFGICLQIQDFPIPFLRPLFADLSVLLFPFCLQVIGSWPSMFHLCLLTISCMRDYCSHLHNHYYFGIVWFSYTLIICSKTFLSIT